MYLFIALFNALFNAMAQHVVIGGRLPTMKSTAIATIVQELAPLLNEVVVQWTCFSTAWVHHEVLSRERF